MFSSFPEITEFLHSNISLILLVDANALCKNYNHICAQVSKIELHIIYSSQFSLRKTSLSILIPPNHMTATMPRFITIKSNRIQYCRNFPSAIIISESSLVFHIIKLLSLLTLMRNFYNSYTVKTFLLPSDAALSSFC